MNRLREKYTNDVVPGLRKEFGYKNVMAVPKVMKVVINMGLGEGTQNAKIVDTGAEAGVYDQDGRVVAGYAGGSFFEGLARPWTGLHTIDAVRRDAAEQQIWFETKLSAGRDKAEVILTCENVKLVYGIDLESDVVERITFLADNNADQDAMGDVRFSYLQEIAPASGEFAAPRPRSSARQSRDRLGIIWLARLAEGKLGQEY